MTIPRGGISVGQKLRLMSAGMLIVLYVCSAPCTPMQDNELQLVMAGCQRAFLENGAFIVMHYLILSPAVCLIYQWFNMCLFPPFYLLCLLLIFVSESPPFYMK